MSSLPVTSNIGRQGNAMETLEEWVAEQGITVEVAHDYGTQVDARAWEHHAYRLTVTNPTTRETIETPWRQGMGIETSPTDTPEVVVDSLVTDAWGWINADSFVDWAEELGMLSADGDDMREAERIWHQLAALAPETERLVGGREALEAVAQLS